MNIRRILLPIIGISKTTERENSWPLYHSTLVYHTISRINLKRSSSIFHCLIRHSTISTRGGDVRFVRFLPPVPVSKQKLNPFNRKHIKLFKRNKKKKKTIQPFPLIGMNTQRTHLTQKLIYST